MYRIVALSVFALAAASAQGARPDRLDATPGKLSKDIVPRSYDIRLRPSADLTTFQGSERIEIEVRRPTAAIELNAVGLSVGSARLSGEGVEAGALAPVLDAARETLRFDLSSRLAPGRYQLDITFGGSVNREDRGLFAVRYRIDGAPATMLATTMEPADARRVFPAWDEPSFRARFRLAVDLPSDFDGYSNTPVATNVALADGLKRLQFGWTPNMASYLVVLVAGRLERRASTVDGVELGVVTAPGKGDGAAFALAANREQLRYYDAYFGIPYPLPKLDHIALPSGYSGAMENWGGIVYNEATLLADPQRSPESVRKLVFEVTAHETAHQWFGNLVTMAWWNDLWLNEGFASWMASKATAVLHPEWRSRLDGIAARESAMTLDALASAHPIQARIDNEAQAADAFDEITYTKGEALLRMLEAYLGEDAFRTGVRTYLARHRYANTTAADLWGALEEASGRPVARIAAAWTTQAGFPLIDVSETCVGERRHVRVAQSPFRPDQPTASGLAWKVPLALGSGPGARYHLLEGGAAEIERPGCAGAVPIDPDAVGYFRVRYDAATFRALAGQVSRLSDTARLKLLDDTWALALSGDVALDDWTRLVRGLGAEPRLAVWNSVLASLATLDRFARDVPDRSAVRRFTLALARPQIARLGWSGRPGETAEDARLRAALALALADAGDPDAIAQARAGFTRYLRDPASVEPAMLDFVLGATARQAAADDFASLRRLLLQAQRGEERSRLLRAILRIDDPVLLDASLDMALAPELPPNMVVPLVQGVARVDFRRAWAFALAHRERLLGNQNALASNKTFPAMAAAADNPADADVMQAYAQAQLAPDAVAEAGRIGDGVRVRAAQRRRLLAQTARALE